MRAWGSPSATQWRDEDVPTVVRRARLEDLFYESPKAWMAAEIRHCDEALGLTPESRLGSGGASTMALASGHSPRGVVLAASCMTG